ncbi:MAG: ribonuclease HII [Opitutales bacterium]
MDKLRRFDLRALPEGGWLCGIDEAGRGALAGPVVAGAVFIEGTALRSRRFRRTWAQVNDSKQLSPAQRETIHGVIREEIAAGRLRGAAGEASVAEIDHRNILGATRLAMQRALERACPAHWQLPCGDVGELFAGNPAAVPGEILVDGRPLRPFPYQHRALVKGDARSFVIALASIVAKVTRDAGMVELDAVYPQYGFARHKGYATDEHCEALRAHGPAPVHRPLFLRRILNGGCIGDETQEDLFEGESPVARYG